MQFECGLLSLLVILTAFRWQRLAQTARIAWSITLVTAAGLSSFVWGPPMLFVGIVFVVIALLIARAVTWVLRISLISSPATHSQNNF